MSIFSLWDDDEDEGVKDEGIGGRPELPYKTYTLVFGKFFLSVDIRQIDVV